jgi:hypothetical protein
MSMTENEAIKNINALNAVCLQKNFYDEDLQNALVEAVNALSEIQRYRAIGTVRGYERAIETSKENYNLYREYKALLRDYEAIGTIEEFKALKEKNNKFIELPCEVNDTVFCILERRTRCTENDQEFDEYSCQGCECLECDSVKEKYISEQKAYTLEWIVSNRRKFGKTMFLTKEEAEKELANKA